MGKDALILKRLLKSGWKKIQKPGAVFIHCIHRLDRPVRGLVLFAKTSKALSRLNELSRKGEIERIYVAEVEGILAQHQATLEHFLIHGEHHALVAKANDKEAKKAILHYEVLCLKEHSTLVQITLETGRYHQIRAQFGAISHPVIGDAKYGGEGRGDCIHLACTKLQFIHPVTKELVKAQCVAPFA